MVERLLRTVPDCEVALLVRPGRRGPADRVRREILKNNCFDRLRRFEIPWGGRARLAGWSTLELYGLHPAAPAARLSAMGAAWLIARTGHTVLEIDHVGVLLVARTSSRLRILRGKPDPDAVLAWEISSRG